MIDETFEKKTRRLLIRSYKESDYDLWRETFSSLPAPKNRWDKGPRELKDLTPSKFKNVLKTQKKNIKNDFFYDLMAFNKKTGQIIGLVSLMDISRDIFNNAYLGYRVLSPYWGKGYGKELAQAGLDIAFNILNLHRVEAGIEPANKRSLRLVKSIGMRREGLIKRRLYCRGDWQDIVIYAMTAEEMGISPPRGRLIENRR